MERCTILERVKKRNRKLASRWEELDIDFLERLSETYLNYYKNFSDLRNIILLDNKDILETCKILEEIVEEFRAKYPSLKTFIEKE